MTSATLAIAPSVVPAIAPVESCLSFELEAGGVVVGVVTDVAEAVGGEALETVGADAEAVVINVEDTPVGRATVLVAF